MKFVTCGSRCDELKEAAKQKPQDAATAPVCMQVSWNAEFAKCFAKNGGQARRVPVIMAV